MVYMGDMVDVFNSSGVQDKAVKDDIIAGIFSFTLFAIYIHRGFLPRTIPPNVCIFHVLDTFTQLGQFTYGASIIIPLLGIAATIATSRAIEQKAKNINTLMTVSASSYFIYLFHTTFEGFTKGIFFKVFTFDDMSNSLIFSFSAIIIIACGVGIPILLYRFVVSRTRATRIMFGIK